MHFFAPKNFAEALFNFTWDGCNTQEKWKTKVMQNLGGKYAALWKMWKWRIPEKNRDLLEHGPREFVVY